MNERQQIRIRLQLNHLSAVWLIAQLERQGISTDRATFSAIIAGTRTGPKVDLIIQKSKEILDEYEAHYGSEVRWSV